MSELTDDHLLHLAQQYGRKALFWRQKFIGLLPEVNKRKLYERRNCSSIFEFAFKFGGLSEQQVRLALNLEKRLEALPNLHGLLVNGAVSINKLVRVVSIANPQNEEGLAEAVQLLPNRAIETFVRDEKSQNKPLSCENVNGLFKPQIEVKSMHVHEQSMNEHADDHTLKLNEEVTEKLYELQDKGIDINQLLLEFLNKREVEIAEEKDIISVALEKAAIDVTKVEPTEAIDAGIDVAKGAIAANRQIAKSRYIPSRIKKLIHREHGTKCSISTCKKPSEHIHHTQTFAISRAHDPHYLAPLCKDHHTIAHSINLKVIEKRESAVI